ncbi:hypothetical protein [Polynucleobacter sp. JS-Fieb-80-E5]|uniref:hypothetical protein n=1 Tax=Polynucleobacter sp. JS-Fieb-80-E5 TaxID=2081050 RepID=UPI001C0C6511|nr:hypothetical protein [Polynucleobacter sp. JS-Fieb-80-E5]MBU3618879.1 hypothetical protein [Polynucleobacter sp. JS-Fieb-80-E5]
MPLSPCKECNNPCSEEAEICPSCGNKFPTLDRDEKNEKLVATSIKKNLKVTCIIFLFLIFMSSITWLLGTQDKYELVLNIAIRLAVLVTAVTVYKELLMPVSLGIISFKDFLRKQINYKASSQKADVFYANLFGTILGLTLFCFVIIRLMFYVKY